MIQRTSPSARTIRYSFVTRSPASSLGMPDRLAERSSGCRNSAQRSMSVMTRSRGWPRCARRPGSDTPAAQSQRQRSRARQMPLRRTRGNAPRSLGARPRRRRARRAPKIAQSPRAAGSAPLRSRPGHTVVDGHQRSEPAFLHERHADGRGDADVLGAPRGLLGRQFACRLSLTTSGRPSAEVLHCQLAEVGQACSARRCSLTPVPPSRRGW